MPIIYIQDTKKNIYIYNVLINTLYDNTKKKKLYIKLYVSTYKK